MFPNPQRSPLPFKFFSGPGSIPGGLCSNLARQGPQHRGSLGSLLPARQACVSAGSPVQGPCSARRGMVGGAHSSSSPSHSNSNPRTPSEEEARVASVEGEAGTPRSSCLPVRVPAPRCQAETGAPIRILGLGHCLNSEASVQNLHPSPLRPHPDTVWKSVSTKAAKF